LAVLRAGFLVLAFRAGLRALVLRALAFRAVAPRRALLAVVFFLLVVRFFPLVLVAMVSAPILPIAALDRSSGRVPARITPPLVQACPPALWVNCFFHYSADRNRKRQFAVVIPYADESCRAPKSCWPTKAAA